YLPGRPLTSSLGFDSHPSLRHDVVTLYVPGRAAGGDRARRDVAIDNAIGGHDSEFTDHDARHDDCVLAYPGTTADAHGLRPRYPLILVGHITYGAGMRTVGHEHVRCEHHIVFDHDL